MRYFLLTISTILILAGCKSKQDIKDKREELTKGTLDDRNTYTVPEVGWTVRIPQDWPVITKKEMQKMNESGKDLVQKSTGTAIDLSALNVLINLKKDAFNAFLSTMEPYDVPADEFSEHNQQVYELLKQTFAAKNIPCEYEESNTKLDGLDFDVFTVKVFDKEREHLILTQNYYSRLINHFIFSIVINYNNKTDQKTLMDMVVTSRFSKR